MLRLCRHREKASCRVTIASYKGKTNGIVPYLRAMKMHCHWIAVQNRRMVLFLH